MRVHVLYFLLLSLAASASELSVKVIDPSSAAVSGAHVSLIRSSDSKVLRTGVTSAEGTARIALGTADRMRAGTWTISVFFVTADHAFESPPAPFRQPF
jgi:5-hydroxyisourate hydrolase-like protein (transthyretin family)